MDKEAYTPEQQKDIEDRVVKAANFIKENDLTLAAQVYKINVGNDVFADKVIPFLQDVKYSKNK